MWRGLNLAVMMQSLNGFHLIRLPAAILFRSSATPLWWISLSLLDYSVVSPVTVFSLPKPAYLHSMMPSTQTMYFFNSFTICAVFPTLNIVLTLHHPTLTLSLGVANSLLCVATLPFVALTRTLHAAILCPLYEVVIRSLVGHLAATGVTCFQRISSFCIQLLPQGQVIGLALNLHSGGPGFSFGVSWLV